MTSGFHYMDPGVGQKTGESEGDTELIGRQRYL